MKEKHNVKYSCGCVHEIEMNDLGMWDIEQKLDKLLEQKTWKIDKEQEQERFEVLSEKS